MNAVLRHPFRVLALESSADDTCAAVVDASRRIWSNVVCRQNDLHERDGGIHPLIALRAHQRNMPSAVQRALREAKLEMSDIDGVAFTRGPGLPGCLSVATNAAKTLAAACNKPLVGVHHMQAHALTASLTCDIPPKFPFLTLLVSGGHTMIVLATSLTGFRIVATTADKSIGSAIDRVVTLLQIKWTSLGPGAGLEKYCAEPGVGSEGPEPEYHAPNPMPGKLAFSYAGLHSWVERTVAAAAFAHLEAKLLLALKLCQSEGHVIRQVVVSGGVASNTLLRERQASLPCCAVAFISSIDNAAMIAWASMHRFLAGDHDDYSIHPVPSWSLQDILNPPEPLPPSIGVKPAVKLDV
ncbi:unnamed protein product [Mycena citricolor]|uniref:N(6)-L-threonylcarbamoyladenine synthase n=1 Tax=Mycena citricolor TaxID=2018698 RepID=A0AAD2Q6F3_9AGAR|nr:unnamed protein product [Mycena citricolor]